MTFATVAMVAALGVIVVLAVLLVSLRRRLDRLAAEVISLRETAAQPAPSPAQPTAVAPLEPRADDAPVDDSPVPVITVLQRAGLDQAAGQLSTGRVVSVTLAGPIIKVAAFSHGLRRALDEEHRMRLAHAFRKELRRQRRLRRRAATTRPGQRDGRRP